MNHRLTVLAAALLLGACATVPDGPGVMVLPGSAKSFDQFRADDLSCRQFASLQTGGKSPRQAVEEDTARGAVVGAALGAVAGAAIGGSRGAGIGAGTGLLFGTATGAAATSEAGWPVQRRYDNAYVQCMYAAGHKVPVSARFTEHRAGPMIERPATAPPPSTLPPGIPPPPPGLPPPPPPGVTAPR
jgi:outer membrane lipoprotein SlyB